MEPQTPPTRPAPSAQEEADGPSSRTSGDPDPAQDTPHPDSRRPPLPPPFGAPEPPKIDWL